MGDVIETIKRLSEPLHSNKLSDDVKLNLWLATQHLKGFGALKPFTQHISGKGCKKVEKMHGITSDDHEVNFTVYPPQTDVKKNAHRICISSTIGCPERCSYCKYPFTRKDEKGEDICFVRMLTAGELYGQLYMGMLSPLVREVFQDKSTKELVVNMAVEGDALRHNFENSMGFVEQICKINKPLVRVILTTSGDEQSLQRLIDDRYTSLPLTIHYSLNFSNSKEREKYMPGTKGHSISREMELVEKVSEMLGNTGTISIADFKGINDKPQHIKEFAALMEGRSLKWLNIKLQPCVRGSLKGASDTSMRDTRILKRKLVAAGIRHEIRAIKIEGNENSGCGNTLPSGA